MAPIAMSRMEDAFVISPDFALAIDTSIAGDTPQVNERESSLKLGAGVGITIIEASGRGLIVNEKIKELWGAVRNSRERKVFYSVAKKETDAIDSTSIFPEVNERLKAAKGVKYASLKDRTKDALVTGWEHFTRHFQHLDVARVRARLGQRIEAIRQ